MLLILFIWLFLGVTFLNVGLAFKKVFGIKDLDTSLTLIFGMFTITLLASFWAIFGSINFEFQLFLITLQFVVIRKYPVDLRELYISIFNQVKEISTHLKIFFLLLLLLVLFQSSSSSFFIDNETYYIQTIKWLNEYGFVPGLANLHIFFGQTSGWHILQSAFSFSYFTNNCNDLNGFMLLVGIVFSVHVLNEYFKNDNPINLWFGVFPLAVVVLLPFVNIPSPDLAVVILSFFLFYYFLKYINEPTSNALTIQFLLAFFIIYIKISALPILLLPSYYYISQTNKDQNKTLQSILLGVIVFILFIIKNTILTGYPLYPSSLFSDFFSNETAIPKEIYNFWWNEAKNYELVVSQKDYFQLSRYEIFVKWISNSWLSNFIAAIIVLLIIIVPFILKKFIPKNGFLFIYTVMIVQIAFLLLTTPQFRFILPFLLFFGLSVTSLILTKKKPILFSLFSSLLFVSFFVFCPKVIGRNHNRIHFNPTAFLFYQLIIPKTNSNLNAQFSLKNKGNLHYFSPDGSTYIWATGDGKLPCVNSQQLEYFEKKLSYIPQLKGKTLAEGFYSKKVKKP